MVLLKEKENAWKEIAEDFNKSTSSVLWKLWKSKYYNLQKVAKENSETNKNTFRELTS